MMHVINHTEQRSGRPEQKAEAKRLIETEDPYEDKKLTKMRELFGIYLKDKTVENKNN